MYPRFLTLDILICCLVSAHAGWTAVGSTQNWEGIATSSDGTKLAAVVGCSGCNPNDGSDGNVWTSIDSGATWVERNPNNGSKPWNKITSSSDGTKLAAIETSGNLWTSADSGATWVARFSGSWTPWRGITSSSDGTKLAACVYNSNFFTSEDSGATWVETVRFGQWYGIASSGDGTKLASIFTGHKVWKSEDSGASWVEITLTGSSIWQKMWSAVTYSSDGTTIAATVDSQNIWISTNSGATWTEATQWTGSGMKWRGITSSSDGTKLAAVAYGGNIWTSTDSGNTWTEDNSVGSLQNWTGITSSSDGTKLAATTSGGNIWTFGYVYCQASSDPSKDGSDGSFYCINGGIVGGIPGSCRCTSCNAGYQGSSCQTVIPGAPKAPNHFL